MDLTTIARQVVDVAGAKGAEQSSCRITNTVLTELESTRGDITLMRTNDAYNVDIMVISDQKKGQVSINRLEEDNVAAAVDQALALAQASAPDASFGVSSDTPNVDITYGQMTPDRDRMHDLLSGLITDTNRMYPEVSLESVTIEHVAGTSVYANSNGVCHREAEGLMAFTTVFSGQHEGRVSPFMFLQHHIPETCRSLLEFDDFARLCAGAGAQTSPISLKGETLSDIVFSPQALYEMIGLIEAIGLGDRPFIRQTSPWRQKLGQTVASPAFTWRAVTTHPELVPHYAVTIDGYKAEDVTVIENGVLRDLQLTREGAAATGRARSTCPHGLIVIEGGDVSVDAMLKPIKRGLLINRFSGGFPQANGDFSGVAKFAFLIEDGRVSSAVTETMIGGNIFAILSSIVSLSAERTAVDNALIPWLHTTGITATGA